MGAGQSGPPYAFRSKKILLNDGCRAIGAQGERDGHTCFLPDRCRAIGEQGSRSGHRAWARKKDLNVIEKFNLVLSEK